MRFEWFLPLGAKGKRGLVRRALGWLGPTWSASPLRRLVQVGSWGLFAWLLFYVAWPYTARPARTWDGWLPAEVDAATGRATVQSEQTPDDWLQPGRVLYVADRESGRTRSLGQFRIVGNQEGRVDLEPVQAMTPDDLDRLTASLGPWSLGEAEPGQRPSHYADNLAAKETIAAESFLALDPLVSISTALAGKTWVWSLGFAGAILLVSVVVPRAFCGYVCPLGTLIDLADWLVGRRIPWFRLKTGGWWTGLKHYVLVAVLVAAAAGVLVSGFVAAIPVVTRGLVFLILPLQTGLERGWHQVPRIEAGHWVSIGLLAAILGLGLLRPRFWCRYVCPTGATFSLVHFLRLTERRVSSACTQCGKCAAVCPFDAVRDDATTRTANCAFCQTCGGVCPVGAIAFAGRRRHKAHGLQPVGFDVRVHPRRGFLAAAIGGAAAVAGGAAAVAIDRLGGTAHRDPAEQPPVRPPGSVPEDQFLQLCIRCGECFQACPNAALQPIGLERGLANLWTPQLVPDWSGCEPSCANCGRVCPTGAIRVLAMEEKRACRIGLAAVNPLTCLPHAGQAACQLCLDECSAAGYDAIEFVRVGTQIDAAGKPIEESGFLAPRVRPEACVGCGLCQTRCRAVNVVQKGLLTDSAIRVEAGEGKEDRLTSGSYIALREDERGKRRQEQQRLLPRGASDAYLPESLDRREH